MRMLDDDPLSPEQAVVQLGLWLADPCREGWAAWVGDWAALEAAEELLQKKGGRVSGHVLSVNRYLLENLPQAAKLAETERTPEGRLRIQTALQDCWERLLRQGSYPAEVLILKHFELVVAYHLDWSEITQRRIPPPVLLLLPGGRGTEGLVIYPRPGSAGQPWPPELTPAANAWMILS